MGEVDKTLGRVGESKQMDSQSAKNRYLSLLRAWVEDEIELDDLRKSLDELDPLVKLNLQDIVDKLKPILNKI